MSTTAAAVATLPKYLNMFRPHQLPHTHATLVRRRKVANLDQSETNFGFDFFFPILTPKYGEHTALQNRQRIRLSLDEDSR